MARVNGAAITAEHVLAAIADYDRMGAQEFKRRYKFGDARTVWLVHDGRHYEAKAIVGVANGYATGVFVTGGDPDYKAGQVRAILRRLGMTVTDAAPPEPLAPPRTPVVRTIPLEDNVVERYSVDVRSHTADERERSEARLLDVYAQLLKSLGHSVCRHTITVDGDVLVTDLFDETTRELVEAKSSVDRAVVRLALGQILDYARFVGPATLAVLVPECPSADLTELLTANGVDVIWRSETGFGRTTTCHPPQGGT